DGRGADPDRTLDARLQPLAPDGVSVHDEPGVAMAHGALHVWTGEPPSYQPRRSPTGTVVTWDGRLDNRDDLLLRLGDILRADAPDVDIVLAAFERWGVEAFSSLVGEWSAAIWDGRARTLHLARDYMGVRPLYYCTSGRSVLWSTSLGELAD